MSETLLRIYHRLPAPARSLAASLRGARLRSWRYGNDTDQLVGEAREREHWTAEQWNTWQENRLGFMLHRAATKVPHYREFWAERRRRGDDASWEYLENWPILEKDALREKPKAFLAEDCNPRQLRQVHTSGTTGKSLTLWRSKQTERSWYALSEARWRLWYGVSRHDRWAILGGQLVTPVSVTRPPFWVWNASLRQLYLSSYHLAPDYIRHYLDALARYQVRYLWGYTSALYELAKGALRLGRRDLKMAVAIANAEPVFDYQRRAIEDAFDCRLRETYGMAEQVGAASACGIEVLHLWPEVGRYELLAADSGGAGELISTGLLNADMPLIRYRVGDRVALGREDYLCRCGRTLPILEAVEGRTDDVLFTAQGRPIGRLDPIFKGDLLVREAQIIQEALDQVRIRFVPSEGFTPEAGRSMVRRLQSRMGDIRVILESVECVPRGDNGKFRAVVCNLPRQQRAELEGANG